MTQFQKDKIIEFMERFWQAHNSHSLSKKNWKLEQSINVLFPMMIKEILEEKVKEIEQFKLPSGKPSEWVLKNCTVEEYNKIIQRIINVLKSH